MTREGKMSQFLAELKVTVEGYVHYQSDADWSHHIPLETVKQQLHQCNTCHRVIDLCDQYYYVSGKASMEYCGQITRWNMKIFYCVSCGTESELCDDDLQISYLETDEERLEALCEDQDDAASEGEQLDA